MTNWYSSTSWYFINVRVILTKSKQAASNSILEFKKKYFLILGNLQGTTFTWGRGFYTSTHTSFYIVLLLLLKKYFLLDSVCICNNTREVYKIEPIFIRDFRKITDSSWLKFGGCHLDETDIFPIGNYFIKMCDQYFIACAQEICCNYKHKTYRNGLFSIFS